MRGPRCKGCGDLMDQGDDHEGYTFCCNKRLVYPETEPVLWLNLAAEAAEASS